MEQVEPLAVANNEALRLAREAARLHSVLSELGNKAFKSLGDSKGAQGEWSDLQRRVRQARAELSAAELAVSVYAARAEWIGFATDVEELLASLEAAPLLSVCPD